jgi:hypothetical protein
MTMTGQQDDLLVAFSRAMFAERVRAHNKHGATSMEQAPLLGHKRASVLTEEAVECAKALNDHEHGDIALREDVTHGYPRSAESVNVDDLDKELIQTAAMAYTWWANRRGDRLPPAGPAPSVTAILSDEVKNAVIREYLADHPEIIIRPSVLAKILAVRRDEGPGIMLPLTHEGRPAIRWPDGATTVFDTLEEAFAELEARRLTQPRGANVGKVVDPAGPPTDDPEVIQ